MKFLKNVLHYLVQIIFANHCLYCSKIIAKEGIFCQECFQKTQTITKPNCQICSYPFEFEGLAKICAKCLTKKPAFNQVITLFRYNFILRKVISDLKYRDQTFIAKKLAPFLRNKIKDQLENFDIISAVPLHKKRLRKRKFNQSILLAKALKELLPQKILLTDLLLRTKNLKPQIQLRKREREKNLNSAFALNKKYFELLKGKKILLIDDVITTSATVENCAKILKKNGAKSVIILTVAKTIF